MSAVNRQLAPWLRTAPAHARAARDELGSLDIVIEAGADFHTFKNIYKALTGHAVLTTFDPECSCLSSSNSISMLAKRRGQYVGTVAAKMFETHDIRICIETGQIFNERSGVEPFLAGHLADELPALAGRIAYFGALAIATDLRGSRVASAMSRIFKLFVSEQFAPDWLCGTCFVEIAKSSKPLSGYGYSAIAPCTKALPPDFRGRPFYLMWTSSSDFVARFSVPPGDDIARSPTSRLSAINPPRQ